MRPNVALIGALFLAGCATGPPEIEMAPGSELVEVVSMPTDIAESCILVKKSTVVDGAMGATNYFVGTRERALQKTKNRAASLGANFVVVDDEESLPALGVDGARGHVESIVADYYMCPEK